MDLCDIRDICDLGVMNATCASKVDVKTAGEKLLIVSLMDILMHAFN